MMLSESITMQHLLDCSILSCVLSVRLFQLYLNPQFIYKSQNPILQGTAYFPRRDSVYFPDTGFASN